MLPIRAGPLEKTGGGVRIPQKNSCKGNLSLKKLLQVVIPKNNKSYALEKIPADRRALKKNSCTKNFSPPLRLFLMVVPKSIKQSSEQSHKE